MKLVTIIPFLKTLKKETLTYFSGKDVCLGDIVVAPVRKKDVEGLVINIEDISAQKGDIKEAHFNLKKIKDVKGHSFFKKSFLDTCTNVKDYFVASTGQILNTLIPTIVFENYKNLAEPEKYEEKEAETIPEKYAFQAPTEDRLVIYKTLIREAFAKKESVFFCFPTVNEAEFFYDFLKKGIEDYAIFLNPALPKKTFIKNYNKSIQEKHSVIVFSTPSFLFLHRSDFTMFIMERESSNSYVSMRKPYLDARIFIESLCHKERTKLIFADSILRTETIWRTKIKEIEEFQPLNFRLPEKEEEEVIDMREDKDKDFQIIGRKVFEKIQETSEKGEHMFLFTLRKGYATTTICNDCGTTLTKDGEPLILFENPENGERFFKATKSRKKYGADILCQNCESWNLVPLGIGTEKVYEEVSRLLPPEKIFILDKTSASTPKKAKLIIKNFEETKGSVLIGTEMALFYMQKEIDNVAIVSFDSLFNIPNFKIYEKIIDLIFILNSYTKKSILLQTRYADEKILKDIQNRNLVQFYKDDIENRKNFKYPPFSTLIKVTYDAPLRERFEVVSYLTKTYEKYSPIITDTRISQNNTRINMILKIEEAGWSFRNLTTGKIKERALLENLSLLPSYWSIQINPEQLY